MTLPLVVEPEAEDDIQEIRRWYERQRPGLGGEFLSCVEAFLAQIQRMPELFPVVDEGSRRGRIRRFPYAVYYEVESDQITIQSVWHLRRAPGSWREPLS